jgi:hypothetical protein
MNTSSAASAVSQVVAWLLVVTLSAIVAGMAAALVKVKEGASTGSVVRSAGVAFVGTMTMFLALIQVVVILL